jgi:Ca2+-binding RTX toxin-like protein
MPRKKSRRARQQERRRRNRQKQSRANRKKSRSGLTFESLEQRQLLATFTVVNALDAGPGSLRFAITEANTNPGADQIDFNIVAPQAVHTIDLASALPVITDEVAIDATTQPGYGGTPAIELNGTGAGASVSGLNIQNGGSGSTIKGLAINRFDNAGILVVANSVTVESNFIGTDATGTVDLGNTGSGVLIVDGSANQIGGTTAAERNIISGNEGQGGVEIVGAASSGNRITGNYIGTDVTGLLDLGNSIQGIRVFNGPTNNFLGGDLEGEGNVVSGNEFDGINIALSNADNNQILGNMIGLGVDGVTVVGNSRWGVVVDTGTSGTVVGSANSQNTISGNGIGGVLLANTNNATVVGNHIGTDVTGTLDRGNTSHGMELINASNNTIGGTTAAERNVISGNDDRGIRIDGVGSTENTIIGNYIGVDATGTADLGNTQIGVNLFYGASNNTIGGTTPGHRNVISGNDFDGIRIENFGSTVYAEFNTVIGNYIGTDYTGTVDLGNSQGGVVVTWDARNNTIGGDLQGEGNLISGNDVDGVVLGPGEFNSVKGNIIGLQADGLTPLGNGQGISVWGDNNTIGSTGSHNIISGNNSRGLLIYAGGDSNSVIGNYIGTDITGTLDRGNGTDGIQLLETDGNTIGGTTAAERNIISGNGRQGIYGVNQTVTNNAIIGNYIGLDVTGTRELGNGQSGVWLENTLNNSIGGEEDNRRNLISGNGVSGISVTGTDSANHQIVGNWIGLGVNAEAIGNSAGLQIQSQSTEIRSNVISGNATFGIEFTDANNSIVQGNFIGTDPSGTRAIGNGTFGIRGLGTGTYTIGTDGDGIEDELEGNVISANGSDAVFLGPAATGERTTIRGNKIGTDVSGSYALVPDVPVNPSPFYGSPAGVVVLDAEVGTNGDGVSDELERNIISGNLGAGLFVYGNSIVAGNFIGVDASGTRAIGNAGDGLISLGDNEIGVVGAGGTNPLFTNVIAGNGGNGITVWGAGVGSPGAVIAGNRIGTDLSGSIAIGNRGHGIQIGLAAQPLVAQLNIIGGDAEVEQNLISYNGGAGLRVLDFDDGNAINEIGRNQYIENGTLGIDVGAEGVTPNVAGNIATSENFPVLTSAWIDGNELVVGGFARQGVVFDLYLANPNASGFGEGRSVLSTFIEGSADDLDGTSGTYTSADAGGFNVGTDTTERFEYRIAIPAGVEFGTRLTTLFLFDPAAGDSRVSEFGNSILVGDKPEFTVPGSSLRPVVTLPAATAIADGETLRVEGSFTDFDSTDWSAVIDFGDGTRRPITLNADRTFVAQHDYRLPGNYTVSVTLTDDSLSQGVATMNVAVQNSAPEIDLNLVHVTSPVNEGEPVVLTGSFQDGANQEPHDVTIHWGDGNSETITVPGGQTSFTASHVYSSRGPASINGAGVDIYRIQVNVADPLNATDSTPLGLLLAEVRNVLPSNLNATFSPTSGLAGDTVTISAGSFVDPGTEDAHQLRIDWGDGSEKTIVDLAAGVTEFGDITHIYNSKPRFGNSFTATIELIDLDQPYDPVRLTQEIFVQSRIATDIELQWESESIEEGEAALLSGSFTLANPNLSHTVIVVWGDGTLTSTSLAPNETSFSDLSHQYRNNQDGGGNFNVSVYIAVADEATNYAFASTTLTVNNSNPLFVSLVAQNVDGTNTIAEGDRVRLTGTISDVGDADRHLVDIDWGDGTTSTAQVDSATRTFIAEHQFVDNGVLAGNVANIVATVSDDDGGSATQELALVVENLAPRVSIIPQPVDSNSNSNGNANANSNLISLGSEIFDAEGDTFTYAWTAFVAGDPNVPSQAGNSADFTFDRSAAPSAIWTIQLAVTDDDGDVGSYELSLLAGSDAADTILIDNSTFAGVGSGILLVLGLGGSDTIDASGVTDTDRQLILDGGADADLLFGSAGDDIFYLRQGDDSANVTTTVAPVDATTMELGNDRYFLTPNSTLTVVDDSGSNALDFELADFGVEFDLSLNNASTLTSQDVGAFADDPNTHFVVTQGSFGELVGSQFGDSLTAASDSIVDGGAGADELYATDNTNNASFRGGDDDDVLFVQGINVSDVSFTGDDGADELYNEGLISGLTFGGGADDDVLTNAAGAEILGTINFTGDDGFDSLQNEGSIETLTFGGGADDDELFNDGSIAMIDFTGDAGTDLLTNAGTIDAIVFSGGADDDALLNEPGGQFDLLDFRGDDGFDALENLGSISGLTFAGGADDDLLANYSGGQLTNINFSGDDGADELGNEGLITGLVFSGGADNDTLSNIGTIDGLNFTGDAGADSLFNEGVLTGTLDFSGGSDRDSLSNAGSISSLNFSGDDGFDSLTNTGSFDSLSFAGGADQDSLNNLSGGTITELNFRGDAGADLLFNRGSVTELTFSGGADQDVLTNEFDGVFGSIDFTGDNGADILNNVGTVTGPVVFGGGADDDTLINRGSMLDVVFTGGADDDALLNDTAASLGELDFRGDDGADLLVNRGTAGGIEFSGGADSDVLTNAGSATIINFSGDEGADTLTSAGTAAAITFSGGADDDVLQNASTATVGTIDFTGDQGADVLVSESATTGIVFTGGADDDALVNRAATGSLEFSGGADDDVLLNTGSDVASISFSGDDGADLLQSTGDRMGSIVFTGDDGADVLITGGDGLGSVEFAGGADDDILINRSTEVGSIIFTGDDGPDQNGADTLIVSGSGADGAGIEFTGFGGIDALQNNASGFTSVTFRGGADDDVLQNNATVGEIDFTGDDGADVLDNNGQNIQQIVFTGGADDDILLNDGANVELIDFTGGADDDVLINVGDRVGGIDFGGDDGADSLVNRGTGVANIEFSGGADNDILINEGALAEGIVFSGDAGDDRFFNQATALATLGIEFFGDDGEDLLINRASFVDGISFHGGADDDVLQNEGLSVSGIDFTGDDGADTLANLGDQTFGISFHGGADDDILFNSGNEVQDISFTGDDGADFLQNNGAAASGIVFAGGADDDTLINNGSDVGLIDFTGDDGADILQNNADRLSTLVFTGDADDDTLQNNGSEIVSLTFEGGADADVLINNGDQIESLVFRGDDGSDGLTSLGDLVASIQFVGGADADVVSIAGDQIGQVAIDGGAGADSLVFDAVVTEGSFVGFSGGDGNDLVAWLGSGGSQFAFFGGTGSDTAIVRGDGEFFIDGGDGDDYLLFQGDPVAAVTVNEAFTGSDDASRDTLDFSAFTGGPLDLDLRSTDSQPQSSNFAVTLSDAMGLENVYGTSGGDTIQGNARDNVINGAEYLEPDVARVAQQRTEAQWVLLDFDSATDVADGEHVYTDLEREQIHSGLTKAYHGPDSIDTDPSTWWFNVRFTQDIQEIATALGYESSNELSDDEFVTILFNETPSFGRPGGEASEVDLGNLNPGGVAIVQVNGLLGGQQSASDVDEIHADSEEGAVKIGARKPIATSENFVALATKIAAHELGHLMGLRHYDTFGPVGFGISSTPGAEEFNPNYTGPAGAFEAVDHLLGSGASIGTDRFNDLRGLFFGEREAVKLALANSDPADVIANESAGDHNSIETAQQLDMVTLVVPNTLTSGLNSVKEFSVQAASVLGQIDLNENGVSESDFYSFSGRRGELVNIEISSLALRGNHSDSELFFDSIIRVYGSDGQFVSWHGSDAVNDDEFESSDSVIIDLVLPADGEYFIEVDSFARLPGDIRYEQAVSLRADLESRSDLTDDEAEFLSRLQDTIDDTDTGTYQLFMYRFAQGNEFDDIDGLKGNGGFDIINGGVGDDFSTTLDLGGPLSVDSGVPFERTIVFSDRAASQWTATVDYGDGSETQDLQITLNEDGQPTFVLSHDYIVNGDFILTVLLSNDIGTTIQRTIDVAVFDVAPDVQIESILTVDGLSEFAEGIAVIVAATATDPSGASASLEFTFEVFKDGATDPYASQSGTDLTSFEFLPADNGSYEIRLSVTDNDGDVSVATALIDVANRNPEIVDSVVPVSGDEGERLSFSASATDAGNDDLTFEWNFGDGTTLTGATVEHPFADGAADGTAYQVELTVTDPDGGMATNTFTVTVNNVAPVIDSTSAPTAVTVATPAVFTASATDIGINDSVAYRWEFGDGSSSANGPDVEHEFANAGLYSATLTVVDSDGAQTIQTFTITVNDTSDRGPTIEELSGPTSAVAGQMLTYSAIVSDPDGLETVIISWLVFDHDGNEVANTSDSPAEFQFAAPAAGSYTVVVTATDATGQTDSRSVNLDATMIGLSGNDLYIAGTDQRDVISVLKYGRDRIRVFRNGSLLGRFDGFDGQIHVNAFGGNDYIFISHRIRSTTWIDGGDGNDVIIGGYGVDHIRGGNGNDWIYGRRGNDWLYGDDGNDFLFGGRGNDRLFGGAGNDWMFGGSGRDLLDGGPGNDRGF